MPYECTVDYYKCKSCHYVNKFEGMKLHIFNYDGYSLYTHSLLNNRTNNLHTNRASSWESWLEDQARVYSENGAKYDFPSLPSFISAWNSFVVFTQDWGYEFICPWCDRGGANRGECDHVGYDAIVCFIKQYRAQNCVNPTTVYDCSKQVKNRTNKCNRYVTDYQTRLLLLRWYQTKFQKYDRETQLEKLKSAEFGKLKKQLIENKLVHLCNFMIWINNNIKKIKKYNKLKNDLQDAFRAIIGNELTFSIFHPQILLIFSDDNLSYVNYKYEIKKYSAVLHSLLFEHQNHPIHLPESFIHTLKHAAKSATKLFEHYKQKQIHDDIKPINQQRNEYNGWIRSGTYYAATKKRNRPLYQTDADKTIPDEEVCNKNFAAFQKVTGGIWKLRCLIHGICLGFHVIPQSEGRNDPFSAVYCHFETAPDTMCGDFNCQVHPYCMSREAEYFANTIFPSDSLHHKGHSRCSEAYNETKFKKKGLRTYKLWNGAAVEERNRVLAKLKEISAHMSLEQFMIQLRLLIEMDNRRVIRDAMPTM